MKSHELRIPVDVPGVPGPVEVAVTVHVPDSGTAPDTVAFGMHGGGYNRRYYDLRVGRPGYSQAEYHTDRGWVVVAGDSIGVGESIVPADVEPTFNQVAAAQDAVVREVRNRLSSGHLVPGLAAAPAAFAIGIGQSMGGCFTLVTQGQFHSYDAVAILAFSAIHTELPRPDGTVLRKEEGDGPTAIEDLIGGQDALFAFAFHWPDVPSDLTALDLKTYPFRRGADVPAWGSPVPAVGAGMLNPGVVAADAAAITTPVLVAVGERDVVPDPRAEPMAYPNASDITVFVVPRMAHMHNFASTREQMWHRIHTWGDSIRPSRSR